MTPMERRDEMVMTLRLHHLSTHVGGDGYWEAVCACGWRSGRLPTGQEDKAHRIHRADALMPKVEEWLAEYAADALEGVMHEVSYDVDAQLLARRADQWRAQATDRRSTP